MFSLLVDVIVGFGFVNFNQHLNLNVNSDFNVGHSDQRSVRAMSIPGIGGLGFRESKVTFSSLSLGTY